MIFVLVSGAREREQRLAVGAYDAITQQVFQAPAGVPLQMQHSRIMYGWPEESSHSGSPEPETADERARVFSEAEAALEPAPALRLDLERLPPDTDVPSAFLCPISLGLMQDPVVAADGHSYERGYISRWLASKSVSPKNNMPLASAELFCNYNLRAAITHWFEHVAAPAQPMAAPGAPTEPAPPTRPDTPRPEIAEVPAVAPGAQAPTEPAPPPQPDTPHPEIAEVPAVAPGAQAVQVGMPRAEIAELLPCAPGTCEGAAVAPGAQAV